MNNEAQAEEVTIKNEEPFQYLTFTLDGENFATQISRVREVLEYDKISPLPHTPDYMLGVINLRGSVVPVMDMRLQFGVEAKEPTVDTCIIIVEVLVDGESLVLGALVDTVQEVIDLRAEEIEPAPTLGSRINTQFIHGMAKVDDEFVIVLDMEQVFYTDELEQVQQQQVKQQQVKQQDELMSEDDLQPVMDTG